MYRPNNNKPLRNDESRRRLLISETNGNEQVDDSLSQVDSESSEEQRSSSTSEESTPFVKSEGDVEDYVKRLRKTGTADNDATTMALQGGATILAAKAGLTYLARFGAMVNKDDIVEEDDAVGGAVAATKLSPQQQQMMNQMAPQASGAAAGGVAAPMASVVVPTPLGSAMASSAATTTAAASQAAVVATAAVASVAAVATVASGALSSPTPIFPEQMQNGTIPYTYIHESGNGVKREYLAVLEQSFEEAYVDLFRDTVLSAAFAGCTEELEDAKMECQVICEYPEWCCDLIGPGVVECPFGCGFVRPDGGSVFGISGALAYDIN